MKVTMQLTLDGLLKALRGAVHQAAEAVERGGTETARTLSRPQQRAEVGRGGEDDRGGA